MWRFRTTGKVWQRSSPAIPTPWCARVNGSKSWLHLDHQGTVHAIFTDTGEKARRYDYRVWGKREGSHDYLPAEPHESIGWIGERYDAESGLQYLNARYYDADLGRFIQPDWFEVTEPGVGTNRYAYSNNDPVNLLDPGGNLFSGEGELPGELNGLVHNGWTRLVGGGVETYDSRTDRRSSALV